MKHKTKTGALPNSAGFPGADMVKGQNTIKITLEEFYEIIGAEINKKKKK